MYVNSHERRIALRLLEIPGARAIGELDIKVLVFDRKNAEGTPPFKRTLCRIDQETEHIVIRYDDPNKGPLFASVPMTFVRAVWFDALSNCWSIHIEGTLFQVGVSVFCPPGRS